LILIPRRTVDPEIALTGLPDEKVAIYSQPNGFICQSIFWAWFEDVFISESCQLGARYQYAGNIVLLTDNCTAHSFPSFESLCTQHSITIYLFRPNSSNNPMSHEKTRYNPENNQWISLGEYTCLLPLFLNQYIPMLPT
jgi:hypothetical protein